MDILTEPAHIKDALSRIVVEVAKREWPQDWPTMIADLNNVYTQGPMQASLVLMIFLRLVEDVLTLQMVPGQRRRDILTSLTTCMPTLFPCFVQTLRSNLELYRAKGPESGEALRVMLCAVELITSLVDWINIKLVVDNGGLLVQLLCQMLSLTGDVTVQLAAADCLTAIAGRKGKAEDRQPLIILFSEDSLSAILSACCLSYDLAADEKSYLLLKKLGLLLVALASLLCAFWGACPVVREPSSFHKYLEALLAFTQHPSQPRNCPDLNLVDYKICAIIQQHVNQSRVQHVDELKECLLDILHSVEHSVIDSAVYVMAHETLSIECEEPDKDILSKYRDNVNEKYNN